MKILLSAIGILLITQTVAAQPKRLVASSTHFSNGNFDTARYYYSGNRGGWHKDAGYNVLPKQMVQRDGSLPIMYDSAHAWNGNTATSLLRLSGRYTNTYDAANRVLTNTTHEFGNAPENRGEEYTYNSAGYHTLIGYIDSAETWPSMAPGYFKASTYNNSNQPLTDNFYYTGTPVTGGFIYRYNSTGQKTDVLQYYNMPAFTLVDSVHFTWYGNGLLRTEQHTNYDQGAPVAGMLDTFGYAGNNPFYTYRRNDQFYTGSNGWQTIWVARNTLNSANGAYDTLYNYYGLSGGPIPSTPSQILVATYNTDSTLDRVSYYNGINPLPYIVHYYYYKEPTPTSVPASRAATETIRVYPVPASSSGSLSVWAEGLTKACEYTVVSSTGRAIISGTMQPGKTISHTNLPAGTYFIRCNGMSKKLVVY